MSQPKRYSTGSAINSQMIREPTDLLFLHRIDQAVDFVSGTALAAGNVLKIAGKVGG